MEDKMFKDGMKHRLFSLQEKRKGDEVSDNVSKLNKAKKSTSEPRRGGDDVETRTNVRNKK